MLKKVALLCTLLTAGIPAAYALKAIPNPPDLGVKSFILIDQGTGRVLAEKDADRPVEPASITKLMTTYVIFHELRSGRLQLTDKVKVTRNASRIRGSTMFLEPNERVTLEKLLKGMIVLSGNDACVAAAEHISGSEAAFVGTMNEYAEKLGMTNSNFMNSTGWPDKKHVMSARDISILTRALITEFPEYYKWFKLKKLTHGYDNKRKKKITQNNRNRLLFEDPTVDGLKTGHTKSAGYCLASSAVRNDMRLISVVLGAKNDKGRVNASRELLQFGYRFYKTKRVLNAGEPLKSVAAWKGMPKMVPVGLKRDLYITALVREKVNPKIQISITKQLIAPQKKGFEIGATQVYQGDLLLAEGPLYTLEDTEKAGFTGRAVDHLRLLNRRKD